MRQSTLRGRSLGGGERGKGRPTCIMILAAYLEQCMSRLPTTAAMEGALARAPAPVGWLTSAPMTMKGLDWKGVVPWVIGEADERRGGDQILYSHNALGSTKEAQG